MNAGPSWNKAPRSHSSGKRQSRPQDRPVSSQRKSIRVGVSPAADDELEESISPTGKADRSPAGSRCQGASGNKLFLDFQSMKLITEDADGDSASDLSDSERVPIPPSPLTPPELHLRAEEIDPVSFDLHPDPGHARRDYYYPDFLPPPFRSWDLRDMAVLLNAERRAGAVPRTGGLLGKYIHRLVQLEWLQLQTIQGERGKGARAKAAATPGAAGALKSPGRSKLVASALSRPHQEGAPKSGPSRKKGFHREEGHPSYYTFETPPQPLHALSGGRLCPQKLTLDMRTEDKKKKSGRGGRLQCWDLSGSDSSSKMESNGNMRIPKQSALGLDAGDCYKACKTQAYANLKKKGTAHNCGHATLSSEKKLKTNGGKQSTHKFK